MAEWIVTGASMVVEADTAEEAVDRAQDSSGWHWEATPWTPDAPYDPLGEKHRAYDEN